ncbi:hypothetical protein B0H14DRAFT_2591161 [Mycena olivaceomarginata]|nr:hypothetical protein B0H14DRAFT_2591161 [Mycena olivaceomarginata]
MSRNASFRSYWALPDRKVLPCGCVISHHMWFSFRTLGSTFRWDQMGMRVYNAYQQALDRIVDLLKAIAQSVHVGNLSPTSEQISRAKAFGSTMALWTIEHYKCQAKYGESNVLYPVLVAYVGVLEMAWPYVSRTPVSLSSSTPATSAGTTKPRPISTRHSAAATATGPLSPTPPTTSAVAGTLKASSPISHIARASDIPHHILQAPAISPIPG